RPGAGHRRDRRALVSGRLSAAIAAIHDLLRRHVGVLRAERPAAQPKAPHVERADAIAPGAPHGELSPRKAAGDRVRPAVTEAGRAAIHRLVRVADAHRDRLLALDQLAVGILAIPGERGALVRRGREALRVELARDADLQFNALQPVRHLRVAEWDV